VDGAPLLLFQVGGELFAFDLTAADEAIELPALEHLPTMPVGMLGVFPLRDQLVPAYDAGMALGVRRAAKPGEGVVVVMRGRGRRIGLVVDDVEDVIMVDLARTRRPPLDAANKILLGVLRHGSELVGIVDAVALANACRPAPAGEDE
jgi:purine-binding chemotaxis protein CheW